MWLLIIGILLLFVLPPLFRLAFELIQLIVLALWELVTGALTLGMWLAEQREARWPGWTLADGAPLALSILFAWIGWWIISLALVLVGAGMLGHHLRTRPVV